MGKLINLKTTTKEFGFSSRGVRWDKKHSYSKYSIPHRTSVLSCYPNNEGSILSVKINTRVQLQACLKLCDLAAIDCPIMVTSETQSSSPISTKEKRPARGSTTQMSFCSQNFRPSQLEHLDLGLLTTVIPVIRKLKELSYMPVLGMKSYSLNSLWDRAVEIRREMDKVVVQKMMVQGM